jgi:hypothetical protein
MKEKLKRNNRELTVGNGILSKSFAFMKSNILAVSVALGAVALGIKKAFAFGETATRLKAQRLAFKNFTESLGEDSTALLAKLTEVSRGTVSQTDLISSAGKALLLGLDPSKIVKLLEIARASAKITGESLTQLFSDVAVGTGRASKLILDNLGIQFSQGEATKRMAAALGVATDELTENQIAQGNLNEVIRQGQPIINRVGTDFTSQADVLAMLKARYSDLVTLLGEKLLKYLPKIELFFLKLSRQVLLNLQVISKLAKGFNVLTDFLHITRGSADRAQHGINNLTKGMEFLDKRIADATATIKQLDEAENATVETSKKVISQAKERNQILENEEAAISKNLKIKLAAIEAGNEAQKTQNELLKKSISETKEELRELEAEVKRASDFNQQILDEIAASQKRRDQAGFDPLEKLVDDLKRAEDNFEQASVERAAGNVDRARELTLKAVQAANAILEVKKGADEDSEVSRQELGKATFEAEKLVKAAKGFALEMKTASEEAVPVVEAQIINLEAQLKLGKATVAGMKDAIKEAQAQAQDLKNKLSENTTATHTQIINTVNTGGGNGGQGFTLGGALPGYGGGDKVPIMAERGEHILRKESVKKLGRQAAVAFNRGDIKGLIQSLPVQKLREGGEVGAEGTTNVNLIMGEKSFPVQAKVSVAEAFVNEIKSINVVRGRKKNVY